MTPDELKAARVMLGLSTDDMATALGLGGKPRDFDQNVLSAALMT